MTYRPFPGHSLSKGPYPSTTIIIPPTLSSTKCATGYNWSGKLLLTTEGRSLLGTRSKVGVLLTKMEKDRVSHDSWRYYLEWNPRLIKMIRPYIRNKHIH